MLVRREAGVFLSASRTEIVAIKGVWARALRRWSMLVRREAGVFRRRMRRQRAEEMARLAASRRAEAAAEAEAEQRYQEHLYQVQDRRADLAAAETDIAEGPRPFAWLSEGAKAVSAEMREASEELRALRGRAPGRRAPANYEHIDARIPRDADDFETVCAEWMQMAGFSGVQRTPKGPDGGVDVVGVFALLVVPCDGRDLMWLLGEASPDKWGRLHSARVGDNAGSVGIQSREPDWSITRPSPANSR